MNIEEIKQNWQKTFDKSVASIEKYLTPEANDYPDAANFRELAKWLLDNPYSGYDYMPNGYKNYKSTPFETESVLSTLHHALLDDGEVSFVKIKIEGEVKRVFMFFMWKNEDCFDEFCRKENQSLIDSYKRGRESQNRVMTSMQEKHPEKTYNIRPLLSEKDITFEAHGEPIAFIREVEDFQLEQQHNREKTELALKKFRNKP
jgi:hypothetical protein